MNSKYFGWFIEVIVAAFLMWCACAIFKAIPEVNADDVVFYIFGCVFAAFAALAFFCDAFEDIIDYFKDGK